MWNREVHENYELKQEKINFIPLCIIPAFSEQLTYLLKEEKYVKT